MIWVRVFLFVWVSVLLFKLCSVEIVSSSVLIFSCEKFCGGRVGFLVRV